MSQQASYFKLGLFILLALGVFLAIVLALSAGALGRRSVTLETYFDESVQGLDIGSAVKYRGVQLGRVTSITFTYNRYELDLPRTARKQYVLVESDVDPALIASATDPDPERLQMQIERGLRVRIAPVGITGTAYLEIDILDPLRNPVLPIDWTPRHLYIPSAPSTYNQIVSGAQNFLVKLDRLDMEQVVTDLHALLLTANAKLDQVPVERLAKNTDLTLTEIRGLVKQLNTVLASPELGQTIKDLSVAAAQVRTLLSDPQLQKLPGDAAASVARVREILDGPEIRRSLASAERILQRLDELTAGGDRDIAAALYNLRRTTENLRELSDTVRRYPGVVLSDPPRPVQEVK
jgi:ABC-type transporter Mla subunit MlaD